MMLVPRDGRNERAGDVFDELRSAGAHGLRNSLRSVEVSAKAPLELPGECLPARVGVGDRDALDPAPGVDQIDHAPVGDPRHGQPGHRVESGLKVERRAEVLPRLREDLGPQLGALALGDVANIAGEGGRAIELDARERQLDRELVPAGAHAGQLEPLPEQPPLAGGDDALECPPMGVAQ